MMTRKWIISKTRTSIHRVGFLLSSDILQKLELILWQRVIAVFYIFMPKEIIEFQQGEKNERKCLIHNKGTQNKILKHSNSSPPTKWLAKELKSWELW